MRDVVLDNFKFYLISLVVVGHAIEPLIDKFEWLKSVYVFIYLFHMPMFAYVSGVLTASKIDSSLFRKIVGNLVIPYVCLEIVYSLFDYYAFSRTALVISPLIPYWILWYLFSLALWRMLLPIVAQFKFPIALSIVLGLACGLNSYDYNLSFSRTFVFFPFFLIGHYCHSSIMDKIQAYRMSRAVGGGFIALILLLLIVMPDANNINVRWLYGSRSYSGLGVEWWLGMGYRLLIYIAAFSVGMALLTLAQKNRHFFTMYGEESLYIYVLHGFVMKGLLAAGLYGYIRNEWEASVLMLGSLALLPILSSRYARKLADNIMNPCGLKRVVLADTVR
ncbi:acyltransferase family protein [Arenicella xantha]|uniref:Fucose 4-O-acetylase-like acetyltransferase n=1 Tax=Arenicella xantha TaxID=644221 RepID=A0A395JFI9_9GAMM|nr:acyltransferase family protein [Arenicella xantha]RBP48530.1 fucose 4-O-acetylase-like acetyltransferase [Arenicella xantha]